MKYSIRILRNGKFEAYLSHKGRSSWSKRQCERHIADCKVIAHFDGCTFELEEV